MADEYILIAKIRKPHGLKGEVSADSHTMDDKRFKKLKRVYFRDAKGTLTEQLVETARITPNGPLLKFKGIDDRDQADELRNIEVVIPESERPPLPEGQAYYDQIIGMTVVDDATDAELGVVKDVIEMPAGEVFVLDLAGKEHLVSNAGEEVRKISVKLNQLRVRLLEEYGG